jgi:hypothetical protein
MWSIHIGRDWKETVAIPSEYGRVNRRERQSERLKRNYNSEERPLTFTQSVKWFSSPRDRSPGDSSPAIASGDCRPRGHTKSSRFLPPFEVKGRCVVGLRAWLLLLRR